MKLQLKRSNVIQDGVAKPPSDSQMEYGELAVNYNADDPVLFIKDSNNNIIRVTNTQAIGNGSISVDAGTGLIASGDNATANQDADTTRVLTVDTSWLNNFINTNGDGAININAGSGLTASGSNATANQAGDTTRILSAKIDPNGALAVSGAGIAAVAKPSSGITVDSTGIGISLPEGGGISGDGTGISIDLRPNSGLELDADGLGIDLQSVSGLSINSSGLGVVVKSDGGLQVDSDGLSITPDLLVDPDYALTSTPTGIRFEGSWSNIPTLV